MNLSTQTYITAPSLCSNTPFVQFPVVQSLAADGYWTFYFANGAKLDDAFACLCEQQPHLTTIVNIKASTSLTSMKNHDQSTGRILVFCCGDIKQILDAGKHVIALTCYSSIIGRVLFHCFKCSDETVWLPVPLPICKIADAYNSQRGFASPSFDKHTPPISTMTAFLHPTTTTTTTTTTSTIPIRNVVAIDKSKLLYVISLNVWFSKHEQMERSLGVVEYIETVLPDIICLQEVTRETFSLFRELLDTSGYDCQTNVTQPRLFFETMFFRKSTIQLRSHEQIPFPQSTMHRELHLLHFVHVSSGTEGMCSTAHFEAGANKNQLRVNQAEFTIAVLESRCAILFSKKGNLQQNSIGWLFAGDTNFPGHISKTDSKDDIDFETVLPFDVRDAWIASGQPEEFRGTWDPMINRNLLHIQACKQKRRFDRIWYKGLNVVQFRLGCQLPIGLTKKHLSDHFAVEAKFQL